MPVYNASQFVYSTSMPQEKSSHIALPQQNWEHPIAQTRRTKPVGAGFTPARKNTFAKHKAITLFRQRPSIQPKTIPIYRQQITTQSAIIHPITDLAILRAGIKPAPTDFAKRHRGVNQKFLQLTRLNVGLTKIPPHLPMRSTRRPLLVYAEIVVSLRGDHTKSPCRPQQ